MREGPSGLVEFLEEEPTPTLYQPWSQTVHQELSCALKNASTGYTCPALSDLFDLKIGIMVSNIEFSFERAERGLDFGGYSLL